MSTIPAAATAAAAKASDTGSVPAVDVFNENDSSTQMNLYSRQIGTFGVETMRKLVNLNVLIVGLQGLYEQS
jgi:hypothetical protein